MKEKWIQLIDRKEKDVVEGQHTFLPLMFTKKSVEGVEEGGPRVEKGVFSI